jgi:hypothetical protein
MLCGDAPCLSAIFKHDSRKAFSTKGLRAITGNSDSFSTHNFTQVDSETRVDD